MAETYVNRQYVAWPWGMRVFFCEEQRDFGIGTSGEQPPLSCGATFDSTCGSLFIVRFVEELRKHRLNLTCRTRRISKDFFQEFFFLHFDTLHLFCGNGFTIQEIRMTVRMGQFCWRSIEAHLCYITASRVSLHLTI